MVFPFGVSVGDFIAGIELIRKALNALEDSTGSSAEYKGIVRTFKSLEEALKQATDLGASEHQAALREASARCAETIQEFLEKIHKFEPSLKNGGSGMKWNDRFRKIQWSLYSKEDVRRSQAELQGHTASIQILLLKAHT